MLVKNPLDKELSLIFKGEVYHINAEEVKEFKDEIANHWIGIYQFMSIVELEKVEKESKKK